MDADAGPATEQGKGDETVGPRIAVVGASAGGVEALQELVAGLPADFPAALLVVIHRAAGSPSTLPAILGRSGVLPVEEAQDGMEIRAGRGYVARPDHHLLVQDGRLRVVRGPRENRNRPAIDPLFRSAALAYGPGVVAVVLTGTLDDGSAGVRAVKSAGGQALVQDPDDALYREMPENAIAADNPEHVAPLARLPGLLDAAVRAPFASGGDDASVDDDLQLESDLAGLRLHDVEHEGLGEGPSPYSCPECSGSLWEIEDGGMLRYRCRVGHAYALDSLQESQKDSVETALWIALRALEERAGLCRRIAARFDRSGSAQLGLRYRRQAEEADRSAEVVRSLLAGQAESAA